MLQLSVRQVELLRDLYVRFDTPVDGFIGKWDELVRLVDEFNRRARLVHKPEEVLHFMMSERKRGLWPRIRREYHDRKIKQAS